MILFKIYTECVYSILPRSLLNAAKRERPLNSVLPRNLTLFYFCLCASRRCCCCCCRNVESIYFLFVVEQLELMTMIKSWICTHSFRLVGVVDGVAALWLPIYLSYRYTRSLCLHYYGESRATKNQKPLLSCVQTLTSHAAVHRVRIYPTAAAAA